MQLPELIFIDNEKIRALKEIVRCIPPTPNLEVNSFDGWNFSSMNLVIIIAESQSS